MKNTKQAAAASELVAHKFGPTKQRHALARSIVFTLLGVLVVAGLWSEREHLHLNTTPNEASRQFLIDAKKREYQDLLLAVEEAKTLQRRLDAIKQLDEFTERLGR